MNEYDKNEAHMRNPEYRNAIWDAYDKLNKSWRQILKEHGWTRDTVAVPNFILDTDDIHEHWIKDEKVMNSRDAEKLARALYQPPDYKTFAAEFRAKWIEDHS